MKSEAKGKSPAKASEAKRKGLHSFFKKQRPSARQTNKPRPPPPANRSSSLPAAGFGPAAPGGSGSSLVPFGSQPAAQTAQGPPKWDESTEYTKLRVLENASADAIKKGYRAQMLKWHPDKAEAGADKSVHAERFRAVKAAYETLSDAHQRALYDCKLAVDRKEAIKQKRKEEKKRRREEKKNGTQSPEDVVAELLELAVARYQEEKRNGGLEGNNQATAYLRALVGKLHSTTSEYYSKADIAKDLLGLPRLTKNSAEIMRVLAHWL